MSEYIDFVVRMRDMMSGMWPKAGATAQAHFNKVNSQINNTQSNLNRLAKPVKMNVDTSSLEKASNMLGGIVGGNLLAAGIERGAGAIKEFVGSSLEAAMQYGMQAKSFEVLTGDAKSGRALVGDLRNLKQTTIMGASVYKNAQTLMGFGLGQGEVIKDLKQIGDIAMGDQERMASLTLAFAQSRAAGKLMGQDLLQFINAGFNPLSVMAERWKDFGFKQKMSVGQLKDAMSEGKISSEMVAKAFELATSKGGKFYNMMEQIGETAGGKMAKLHGNIAAMKIDIGNALLPMQNVFVDMANDALHWAHISRTVPETILAERMEVNALVDSIASLNEGDSLRGSMIDMLNRKYPDLLDGIDTEKLRNEELLGILKKVNNEYDRRIDMATNRMIADDSKKQLKDWMELATKAKAEAHYERLNGGKKGDFLNLWDYMKISKSGMASFNISNNADYLEAFYKDVMNYKLPQLSTNAARDERTARIDANRETYRQSLSIFSSTSKEQKIWGDDWKKNEKLMRVELLKMGVAAKKMGGAVFENFDFGKMESLVRGGSSGGGSNAVSEAGSKVTGGGGRSIYINFKNIVENFNNHGATEGERKENAAKFSKEAFLSFLKSIPSA